MRWSLDPEGAIAHVSREWQQFTGFSDGAVAGAASRPSVHPDDRDVVDRAIRSAIEMRTSYLVAFRSVRPNNKYSWVMSGAAPSFSPADGNVLGYLGDTELLQEAPVPPKAFDMLRRLPHGSRHQIGMLDMMADHITTARNIAKHTDDVSLKKILDYALLSIGDLLYTSIRR